MKKSWIQFFWDLGCLVSLVGIWPRYIEPELLETSHIDCPISNLPEHLKGFRIVQFSDLHINRRLSSSFLKRLKNRILTLKPQLILFTGDFLCYSHLSDKKRLLQFLCGLKAPYGCFAILGNHDYEKPVTVNPETGSYDITQRSSGNVAAGFKLLFHPVKPTGAISDAARKLGYQKELISLLESTPFKLLHNETVEIPVNSSSLNLVGLGEYSLGKTDPAKAFATYNLKSPGIILSHNPDSIPLLEKYPGHLILCGHTHGAQINLPLIWNRLTLMETPKYKRGLHKAGNKLAYINRGVGSVFKFRWFSKPEVTCITLKEPP